MTEAACITRASRFFGIGAHYGAIQSPESSRTACVQALAHRLAWPVTTILSCIWPVEDGDGAPGSDRLGRNSRGEVDALG